MTAKQQLRQLVEEYSEVEAAEALNILASRRRRDSLSELLDNAPEDDEPVTPEEEALVQEARDEIARGEPLISLDELRAELGFIDNLTFGEAPNQGFTPVRPSGLPFA